MNKHNRQLLMLALIFIGLINPLSLFATPNYQQDPEGTIKSCRGCHDNHRRQPLLKNSNPTTHHLLHNTRIKQFIAPNSSSDTDGLYDCMTCHTAILTENGIDISAERDCLQCHDSMAYWPNRHHALLDSIANPTNGSKCSICHALIYDKNGRPTGLDPIP